MASLVLAGDTSGSVTVTAPAVAGSNTQTLVATTGTLAPIVSGTASTTTGGTSIDFTSIPSWVKRITIMLSGVSTSGTSILLVQLGSGSFETSGYTGASMLSQNATSPNVVTISAGFPVDTSANAASVRYGSIIITQLNSATNLWSAIGNISRTDTATMSVLAGTKALAGVLDRVRITATNGTDTFDLNGGVNILYE